MASTGNLAVALCLAVLSLTLTARAVMVQVTSAMPTGQTVDVRCGDTGGENMQEVYLSPGKSKQFTPTGDAYYCVAIWNKKNAAWKGYYLSRDQGHTSMYWKVQSDALYLSYNNAAWSKAGGWV